MLGVGLGVISGLVIGAVIGDVIGDAPETTDTKLNCNTIAVNKIRVKVTAKRFLLASFFSINLAITTAPFFAGVFEWFIKYLDEVLNIRLISYTIFILLSNTMR